MERTTEMKLRYLVMTAAAGLALATSAGTARADGLGCTGPGCFGGAPRYPTLASSVAGNYHPFQNFFSAFQKPKLPVFQAAPWYQYWPYDAHFLTPAPISGPFYGPPLTGNFPVNPYFPGPAGAYGFGAGYGYGYGIPGGPPPQMMPPPGR
jgi:hypothetical protein